MAEISSVFRQLVTNRANGLCEYCHIQQIVVVFMEIDHIIPLSVGGMTTLDNLCLACPGCNAYKLDHQVAIDAQTGQDVRLFNPRIDNWADHFEWVNDAITLIGRTSIARAIITRLRMNRASILISRQVWHESGWHPPISDL